MSAQRNGREERYLPALRFRSLTRFYDPLIRWTTRETTFKRRLLEQVSPGPGDRILDLGCGTGTLAVLIKRAQTAAEVSGLDADPEMLAPARAKAAADGVEIRFDEGLSNELPYEDGFFDTVVSTLFFHHLAPQVKRQTAAEIARVLRPGGKLHVADWGRPSDPLMRVLSVSIPLLDGFEPTRDNLAGGLPRIFEAAGLAGAAETGRLRTAFGTMAFYRAERPEGPA
ncbi:MAG: class I SAM-dependent methyltransferase [Solirubrobacterales bacterium]